MKTCYKVYSIGKNAQPSYIQDDDASAFIIRRQKQIGQFDSPMHYHLDKYHNTQKSKQDYSIDSLNEINSHEIVILRKHIFDISKECTSKNIRIKGIIPKYHDSKYDKNTGYISLRKSTYGLIGIGPRSYDINNKPFSINLKAYHCNVYDLTTLYNTKDCLSLKNKYARAVVVYPAKSTTHIFKEYTCNVVLDTPLIYTQDLQSGQSAKFKYKKTVESPRQRAFRVNSVLATSIDDDNNLNGASTTVLQKTDVTINRTSGNISLIIQKMEFFELKLDGVTNVTDLPEGVEYFNSRIRGSITNSGEYFIHVQYGNAIQTINIIVPFYRRIS